MDSSIENLPKLSAVIPSKNRSNVLLEALKRLNEGRCIPDEVIVVDDCSDTPISSEVSVDSYSFELRLLRNETAMGACVARNRGIRAAKHPILLLMDDDVWPDREMVYYHKYYHVKHDDPGYTVIGRVIFDPMLPYTPLLRFLEASGPHSVMASQKEGQPCAVVTANISLKHRFLKDKRLFDESFPFNRNEDTEFGQRLMLSGLRSYFHCAPCATHHSPLRIEGWLRVLNQSGQCKAHWSTIGPDDCTFTTSLPRVLETRRLRSAFEAAHDAMLQLWGPDFLDTDVGMLSGDELEFFDRFMEFSQGRHVEYGMYDYYARRIPGFVDMADCYDRAMCSSKEAFDGIISEYMERCGDFIPGLYAGMELCHRKQRHDLITLKNFSENRWCGVQYARAQLKIGHAKKALTLFNQILETTAHRRLIDVALHGFILEALDRGLRENQLSPVEVRSAIDNAFFIEEFRRIPSLRNIAGTTDGLLPRVRGGDDRFSQLRSHWEMLYRQ